MAISMLKIRRPLGRLIFNMGIAIPGKTVFLIETAPRWSKNVKVNEKDGSDLHLSKPYMEQFIGTGHKNMGLHKKTNWIILNYL